MTKVKLHANSWLKRYLDHWEKWHDITRDTLIFELEKSFPGDTARIMRNMQEGRMVYRTKYAEYMYLENATFEDELPRS